MPVKAIPVVGSVLRNGVGAFVHPCKRITLRFCNWGGSSKGMRELLRTQLKDIAAKDPKIEFNVLQESGHPVIQGEYTNGVKKTICVRNKNPTEILEKLTFIKDCGGTKLKKYKRAVESTNESVRGVWSPFHVEKEYRFKI
ncbi:mitochondrial 54S ribosomal protein [Starmerella bacillaris]|uniref:Large ribosomal subunit protein mL43 n=1 Tax=Starmerella bacillaris TaxID=1247836 RepID=A0AAV5RLC5_STABA|nr:mitochondrial 54S ribosomal protein [Starmerella bacillaris]